MVKYLAHGHYDQRFSWIRSHLEKFLVFGQEQGASITVNYFGRDVVDIWGGHVDEAQEQEWMKDTIVNVFLCSHAVVSLAVLMLVDRGRIHVDERVSRYWPEFGVNGKEDVRVRHLLSHTAGLAGWRHEPTTMADVYNMDVTAERLAAQAP
ncbi:hypothetical protein E4U41_007083, partial [Claviceps citrina]